MYKILQTKENTVSDEITLTFSATNEESNGKTIIMEIIPTAVVKSGV